MRLSSPIKVLDFRGLNRELRDFIARGNVVDLTVGVAIGGAFTELVRSFTQNVVTPPVRAATQTLGNWAQKGADAAGNALPGAALDGPVSGLGAFAQQFLGFLIVAGTTFTVAKAINRFRQALETRAQDAAPKSDAAPAVEDVAVRQIAQNERIIALLESLVASQTLQSKPKPTDVERIS